MIKKLLFSLLGLLASVVALWGVVRLGWTVEMFGPGLLSMVFFGIALAVGNQPAPVPLRQLRLTADGGESMRGATQRYEWGKLTPRKTT
jgi:hypothetical protein